MSFIEFQNVSYISENKTILKEINLSINSGDYISVVGPSGSGKSTFLKLCCHLISPTMLQKEVKQLKTDYSYLLYQYLLEP